MISSEILILFISSVLFGTAIESTSATHRIFKKIKVPSGSSLSLTIQISRPKILSNFIHNDKAYLLDAVVEIPIWLDVDRFVDAMYNNTNRPATTSRDTFDLQYSSYPSDSSSEGESRGQNQYSQRCELYEYFKSFLSSLLFFPESMPHDCLLRLICDFHEIRTYYFYQDYAPSLAFELIQLLLSPSLDGNKVPCSSDYSKAEQDGKYGFCYRYDKRCPIKISSFFLPHLFPIFNFPISLN